MAYRILKQFVPVDTNQGDPEWAKRQIWVQKLNAEDSVDEFDTLEEAETKKSQLENSDPKWWGKHLHNIIFCSNNSYSVIILINIKHR